MTDAQDMLPGEWPEPVVTADMIIERNIKEALTQETYFHLNLADGKAGESDDARELRLVRANMHCFAFLLDAVIVDVLTEVQGYNRAWADSMAAAIDRKLEWGEHYPEMLWQWANDRGLDPEQLGQQAKEKFAENAESRL
ncbi:hypothetical protein SAMN04487912_102381 [Arthrobacter sp. cf158]|uniref:hypothetical protein n=1 Tax=Arthrobacter sp. cf158 TaxID=1761744 RepID=UPI00089D4081|nr:hypothetical protein [Arthrobacter sp. cf158]SDW33811.1 hypothetical protein SAMN04487912_102381 [Arthrobacter sp. cf158]